MIEKDFLLDAIVALSDGNYFVISDMDLDNLVWQDENFTSPTKEDILAKKEELEMAHSLIEYKELRKREYPSFIEYLDGIVKGDQEQIDAYITACLAVKAKYPKPV
jgi:hypothetical protein